MAETGFLQCEDWKLVAGFVRLARAMEGEAEKGIEPDPALHYTRNRDAVPGLVWSMACLIRSWRSNDSPTQKENPALPPPASEKLKFRIQERRGFFVPQVFANGDWRVFCLPIGDGSEERAILMPNLEGARDFLRALQRFETKETEEPIIHPFEEGDDA